MDLFIQAFGLIFDPYVLVVITLSGAFGLFMGAIPGLSATMATALLMSRPSLWMLLMRMACRPELPVR